MSRSRTDSMAAVMVVLAFGGLGFSLGGAPVPEPQALPGSEALPPVGEAVPDAHVGYHNRSGGHSVEMFDWLKVLESATLHLKP